MTCTQTKPEVLEASGTGLDSRDQLYNEALRLARTQEFETANSSFEALVTKYPDHTKAWISYAQLQKKRFKQVGPAIGCTACKEVLERAFAVNPSNGKIVQALGLIEMQMSGPASALPYLEKAVELDPSLKAVLSWQQVAGERQRVQQRNSASLANA